MAEIDFRTRLMALMVYGKEEEIDLFLASYNNIILHFAYIEHDQDVDRDGKPVESHFHLCLYLKTDYYITDILNKIKAITHQNAFGEVLSSKKRFYNYLTHKGKPDKFQYPKCCIISDNTNYWIDKNDLSTQCVFDICNGADELYLLNEYGNFFLLHSDQLYSMATRIMKKGLVKTTQDAIEDLINSTSAEAVSYEKVET